MQLASSLRQMRIVHGIFAVAIVLYAYTAEQLTGKNGSGVQSEFLYGIITVAGLDGLIAYYFRRTKLLPALEKLRMNANDSEALKQWRFSTILSMCLALSIALYGFVLRFLGASRHVSWSFYVAALVLLLIWRPQLEIANEPAGVQGNQ